jgi:hypothetical protein
MRRLNWTKANEIAGPTTCVLTAIILLLMVWPLIITPAPHSNSPVPANNGSPKVEVERKAGETPWIMPSILALALIIAGFLHFKAAQVAASRPPIKRVPVTPVILPPQPIVPALPGRVLATITTGELFKTYETHTKMQADAMVNQYIGAWLGVAGNLWDVQTPTKEEMLVSIMTEPIKLVFCHFAKEHEQQCLMFHKGDEVRVAGKITSAGALGIHLSDCEFV